jgi:hypothetical protein
VSSATAVPETWELTGDGARETLARVGRGRLLGDAFLRLRFADGFSHARSMAFATTLALVQGVIAVVGLAAVLGTTSVAHFTVRGIRSAVPGPASHVLTDAVSQAAHTGASDRWLPVVLGTVGALVTGATLLGQLERALNRMYGVEQDRLTVAKYTRALALALTAGAAATVSFILFAFGRSISNELGGTARPVWGVLRWPIAIGLAIVAFGLLFRWAPASSAGVVVARVRLDDLGRLVVCGDAPVRPRLPLELDVRADLRPFGGHRRAAALGAGVVRRDPLRRRRGRAAGSGASRSAAGAIGRRGSGPSRAGARDAVAARAGQVLTIASSTATATMIVAKNTNFGQKASPAMERVVPAPERRETGADGRRA